MRILYIVHKSNIGGLQTSLRNRIRALRAKGVDAEVVLCEKGDGAYIFDDIPHKYIYSGDKIKKKIKQGNYDYVSFIFRIKHLDQVPEKFKGKIIYEIRGWSPQVQKIVSKLGKSASVDAIVSIAKYIKPLAIRYSRGKIPVFVDGNAVDPMFKFIKPDQRTWRDCPVPDKGRKVIAFVGRVQKAKNWMEFVKICEKVAKTERIEMWVICNPNTSSDLGKLQNICNHNRLKHIYRVIHSVPNQYMPQVYSVIKSSGGCMLSTSTREGLGNAILEPLACGLPVVSSDVAGKNEIITHRKNGMLYPLGHIDKAVRCVKIVLNDSSFRKSISRNGLRFIAKHFHPKIYTANYLKILSKISRLKRSRA